MPPPALTSEAWITFLRTFSPQAANDSQIDERNKRYCKRHGIKPFDFEHPFQQRVLQYLTGEESTKINVVLLTGTAGDGKSRITHNAWRECVHDDDVLHTKETYFRSPLSNGRTLHLVRDMSALTPDEGEEWRAEHIERLQQLCQVSTEPGPSEHLFLVATNDGQFLDGMRALKDHLGGAQPAIDNLLKTFENLLLNDTKLEEGYIRCVNMSLQSSAVIFDLALKVFLGHEGWNCCVANDDPNSFFGPNCYVRRNLEILRTPIFQTRLRSLIELCDCNDIHISVREIFILLSNAILGNSAACEGSQGVPKFSEIEELIRNKKSRCGSIYSNVLGANLPHGKTRRKHIYEALDRFQIGNETTFGVDTLLIFGRNDPDFVNDFKTFVANDPFYGDTEHFSELQRQYIDTEYEIDEENIPDSALYEEIIYQRRRLFFTLPEDHQDYPYWSLTVFRHAKEYISQVVQPLNASAHVRLALRKKLALGINRIFIGLLVDEQNSIYLAASATQSQARVSRMVEKQFYVDDPDRGSIQIEMRDRRPTLVINGYNKKWPTLTLTLTRFEFILRVADGALPTSFSKECFEDINAFKTQLLSSESALRKMTPRTNSSNVYFRLLQLTADGKIEIREIELEEPDS
jgi:hypothetical protein